MTIGVHLGQMSPSDEENCAISFTGSKVREMLRGHLFNTKVSRQHDFLLVTSLYKTQVNQ